jgi:uncharacterized membrane protein YfcA
MTTIDLALWLLLFLASAIGAAYGSWCLHRAMGGR